MKLAELSEGVGRLLLPDAGDLQITHITHDSRRVQYGSLYVAIEGANRDGHEYIGAACQLGAVSVMTTKPDKVPCRVPIVEVDEPRRAMARMTRRLYGRPDEKLRVVGVTGTNGKTSFTYIVNYLLQPLGLAGRMGTLSYFNGNTEEKASHTTPESSEVFRTLGEMVANGCRYASVEISSHGLTFDRVLGMELQYAVFTNLSRDHLDFHGDMEAYFKAKHKQFDMLREGGVAVINGDCEYGRRIQVPEHAQRVRYGQSDECELRFEMIGQQVDGTRFEVFWQGERKRFHIPLLGVHNVYNFTAALAVVLGEGLKLSDLDEHHPNLPPPPGRMEPVVMGQEFGVIIDFAHTPDALDKVLQACKGTKPERLICVFGAGGDRDVTKRAEMGAIVDRYADVIIMTSDNPRSEDPQRIMDMIQEGIKRPMGDDFFRDWDRRESIELALRKARAGDLVLIAGRGHETHQEINGRRTPFNDREVAAAILEKLLDA